MPNITLFEKDGRLGGNAYTYDTSDGETLDIAVAAYSKLVSGEFLSLLSQLKIKAMLQPASSFLSVHNMETNSGIYLTPHLSGLLAQKFALFRPSVYFDIKKTIKGMRKIIKMLNAGELGGLTVQEAIKLVPELDVEGRTDLMMAPLCLLSSMYYGEIMKGPAEFFLKKLSAFGNFEADKMMFQLYFPKKFTRSYVDALVSHFKEKVVINAKIKSVGREAGKVTLKMQDGQEAVFDEVVFACNADQALALLESPTAEENRLLGRWRYKDGLMVIHRDNTHFPRRELCQTWTCLQSQNNGYPHFSISLCSWRSSPGTSFKSEYLGTQHPNFPIKEELVECQKVFRTPVFDFDSCPTIKELPSLNGKMQSYYCGSHFGLGLHNDAVTSAIDVARHLGVEWKG